MSLVLITGPGLIKKSYCNYLDWIGQTARLIPPNSPVPREFHGLVLAGGGDIEPKHYNQQPKVDLVSPDPDRDEFEMRLLRLALERGVPVLGICRGIQLLNVALGGRLIQHIDGHSKLDDQDNQHDITLKPNSMLHRILGKDQINVNSAHHQAVDPDALGKGLVVSAMAGDVIEGLELQDHAFVIGVQWHPERHRTSSGQLSPSSLRLREAFLRAVEEFALHG